MICSSLDLSDFFLDKSSRYERNGICFQRTQINHLGNRKNKSFLYLIYKYAQELEKAYHTTDNGNIILDKRTSSAGRRQTKRKCEGRRLRNTM